MRMKSIFLSASVLLACAVPVFGQQAPDQFKDVDRSHWAYDAIESLRSKGLLIGYPDGFFRGKRTLSRYELAVAVDRALKYVLAQTPPTGPPGDQGPTGPQGEVGPAGPQGPPGVVPEDIVVLRRLTSEFRDQLAALGNNIAAINRRLDDLAKRVAALQARLDKMPVISGGAHVGFRSDRANHAYVDRDGRPIPLLHNQAVVHTFDLGVAANIPGGATLDSALIVDNYKNYLGGSLAQVLPLGGSAVPEDLRVDRLAVTAPLMSLGRGSQFTIGRFPERISRLTLWKPDVDTYFQNPFVDDGAYRMDGARLTTSFGSVQFEALGAQLSSVQGTDGLGPINSPLAGSLVSWAMFNGNVKVKGQPPFNQLTVDQLLAVNLGLGIRQLQGGHIRVTAMDVANRGVTQPSQSFSGVQVLGADGNLKITDRVTVTADWAKTMPHYGHFSTVMSSEDNAANANVGYSSGPLSVAAGYRYIEPEFFAPGYWGRIGNWLNPTNIQGPTVRASYDITKAIGVSVGGDFYTAARDRAVVASMPSFSGLGKDDEINRILVGLHWDVVKNLRLTADWEGVYWTLKGPHPGIPAMTSNAIHPIEHYVDLGLGYNLTTNTVLKLGYQIGSWDGRGALGVGPLVGASTGLPIPGLGQPLGIPNTKYNFGVFTSQLSVRF